jgi:hypothetical protein
MTSSRCRRRRHNLSAFSDRKGTRMSMTIGKLWIPCTIAKRLWQSTRRITNYENSFSGFFYGHKRLQEAERTTLWPQLRFLGGLQFKSQLQVGLKPYLRIFFDISDPIMRAVRILVGWFAQWIDIMWIASDLTSDSSWT